MEITSFAPVLIPTLNRYEHLRRCVDSLSRCTHADKTELIIGLDYPPSEKYVEGYNLVKDYLPTIQGFKKVTIIERHENYGAIRNLSDLQHYAFKNHATIIITEDDNEFSKCFLDYMNKMLVYYANDVKVASVCGYTHPNYYGLSNNLLFTRETNAWGIGFWREKETEDVNSINTAFKIVKSLPLAIKSFLSFPAAFGNLIPMLEKGEKWGDVIRCQYQIISDKFQVRPYLSLCRNWGFDGSGLHCSRNDKMQKQKIFQSPIWDKEPTEVSITLKQRMVSFKHLLPLKNIPRIKSLIMFWIRYYKFRKNLKKQYHHV